MDPLTAFGLAGTIVQFLDFCGKIVLGTREVYLSGSVGLDVQAEAATRDLLDFTTKLQPAPPIHNGAQADIENDVALRQLCEECSDLAKQMLQRLNQLTREHLTPPEPVPRGASLKAWEKGQLRLAEYLEDLAELGRSLRLALRSMWSRKELEELEQRLEKCRAAIQLRMVASLRNEVQNLAIEQSRRFESLDRETKQIVGTLLDDMRLDISRDIKYQTQALAQMMSQQNIVVIDRGSPSGRRLIDASQTQMENGMQGFEPLITEMFQKEEKIRKSVGKEILQDLHFETQTERYEAVHDAHAKTFGWIFKQGQSETPYDCFVTWLESGENLYWINGKAGSGKSTLMRYICDNPRTKEHLLVWSGEKKLVVAYFYFWNIGNKLQKSQIGLLRYLIYQVLEQVPDLIPVLFPSQWAAKYSARSLELHSPSEPWSVRSLMDGWNTLTKYLAQGKNAIKLCIFVDGLDEFDGLDADMTKLFNSTADMLNIKVCASSRPHVVFENAFLDRPSLRLQDLTHGDIQAYIEDRLVQDPSMQDLSAREPLETAELVQDIVAAADGVFLWVYLVVEGLLRGLGNCDEISDLKRKLRLLPKDLKQLYYYMILKVDDDYKEEAVSFFQLVNATQPLENDSTDLRPMTLLTLCLAKEKIDKLPMLAETCVRSPETMIRCCHAMSRRLQSRTGGLLEVQLQGALPNRIAPGMKVGYLHRTVREFLITKEMRDVLQAETLIDPDYEMLKASVYEIQIQFQKSDREELCRSALQYARRVELRNQLNSHHIFLIDQLHGVTPRKYLEHYIGPSNLRDENTYERFLRPAVQWDLHSYVRRKLEANPHSPTSAQKISLLYISLSKEYIICPKMILILLSLGADPFATSGENAGNASLQPVRGETVSQQRLILFHKAIEYLGGLSTSFANPCYSSLEGTEIDPSLKDWAEVLRTLLGVAPESLEEKPRPISTHLRRAYEVISKRFCEYPLLKEELQRCLVSASPREKVLAKPIYPASRLPEQKEEENGIQSPTFAPAPAPARKFCCFQ